MTDTSDDSCELTFAFAKAEISTHPDLGFLALRLIRFDADPSKGLVPGVLHRLRPEHAEDLIGHLQAALEQYRSPKAQGSSPIRGH
jgi:hypothetical protein